MSCALICSFLGIALYLALGPLLKTVIYREVRKTCPACQLSIESVKVNLFSSSLIGTDIHFKGDSEKYTSVSFALEKLDLKLRYLNLIRKEIRIDEMTLQNPKVILTENHAKPDGSPTLLPFPKNLPDLYLAHASIKNGEFLYVSKIYGKSAPLGVFEIQADLNYFATRSGLATHSSEFKATCRLEQSGIAHLHASFDPLARRNQDYFELDLRHQNLSELDPFFLVDDGIELEGTLDHAFASANIHSGQADGKVGVRYQNLNLHFHATPDRSQVSSFFSGVAQSVLTAKTRPKSAQDKPEANFHAVRKPQQSIANFLITGFKAAALQIITH